MHKCIESTNKLFTVGNEYEFKDMGNGTYEVVNDCGRISYTSQADDEFISIGCKFKKVEEEENE